MLLHNYFFVLSNKNPAILHVTPNNPNGTKNLHSIQNASNSVGFSIIVRLQIIENQKRIIKKEIAIIRYPSIFLLFDNFSILILYKNF